MNDLLPKIFSAGSAPPENASENLHHALLNPQGDAHSGGGTHGEHELVLFLQQVDGINLEMEHIRQLLFKLKDGVEKCRDVHQAQVMKSLRKQMDGDVVEILEKAASIRDGLDGLDQANLENRAFSDCEKGNPVYRIRIFVTNGLRGKLKELMVEFDAVSQNMREEYRETIERRYYVITGHQPDESIVGQVLETGMSEDFLRIAIERQGRGHALETVQEIQERYDAVKGIEQNLLELHQIFLDMSVLVETQGAELDDIERSMLESASFIKGGVEQLEDGSRRRKNTQKLAFIIAVFIVIAIAAVTVLIVFLLLKRSKGK